MVTRLGLYGGPRPAYVGFTAAETAATALIETTILDCNSVIEGGAKTIITLVGDTWAKGLECATIDVAGSGTYWTSPDTTVLDAENILDIRALVAPDDWDATAAVAGDDQLIIGKWNEVENNSWYFAVEDVTGYLRFVGSQDGAAFDISESSGASVLSAGAVDGEAYGVRALVTLNDGGGNVTVQFYTSSDFNGANDGTWTPLGSEQSGVTKTLFNSTTQYTVGTDDIEFFNFKGDICYAGVAASDGGDAVLEFYPIGETGNGSFVSATGEIWTGQGGAVISGDGGFSEAQLQATLDGITSDQSEALGWNNTVRDTELTSSVVCISDTVVEVTWTAAPTYLSAVDEVITVTVPASVLTGGVAIVGTPTYTITCPVASVLMGFGGEPERKKGRKISNQIFEGFFDGHLTEAEPEEEEPEEVAEAKSPLKPISDTLHKFDDAAALREALKARELRRAEQARQAALEAEDRAKLLAFLEQMELEAQQQRLEAILAQDELDIPAILEALQRRRSAAATWVLSRTDGE